MKVTNEIRIRAVNGKDTTVGDDKVLVVTSTSVRRHAVDLAIVGLEHTVVTVDAAELTAAIQNATNEGSAL